MGLVGLLFNLVTFPGILVNGVVQAQFEGNYDVPTHRIAVAEDADVDLDGDVDDEALQHMRMLDGGEQPREDEDVELVTDYSAVERYPDLFRIVLGPFFLTSAIALVLFAGTVVVELLELVERQRQPLWWLVAFYPGFVTAAHAFPNADPTSALWEQSKVTDSPLRFVGYPIAAVSKLFALLRFLWIDAVYAILLYALLAVPFGLF